MHSTSARSLTAPALTFEDHLAPVAKMCRRRGLTHEGREAALIDNIAKGAKPMVEFRTLCEVAARSPYLVERVAAAEAVRAYALAVAAAVELPLHVADARETRASAHQDDTMVAVRSALLAGGPLPDAAREAAEHAADRQLEETRVLKDSLILTRRPTIYVMGG